MKENVTNNLYVIYNEASDLDKLVTPDLKEALEEAGALIDDGVDQAYSVLIYKSTTSSMYYDNQAGAFEPYSLAEFVKNFSPFKIEKEKAIDTGIASPEVYHNLSEEEKIEVLHFIPDQMIIDELSRRFKEYRSTSDLITSALDEMKIYV